MPPKKKQKVSSMLKNLAMDLVPEFTEATSSRRARNRGGQVNGKVSPAKKNTKSPAKKKNITTTKSKSEAAKKSSRPKTKSSVPIAKKKSATAKKSAKKSTKKKKSSSTKQSLAKKRKKPTRADAGAAQANAIPPLLLKTCAEEFLADPASKLARNVISNDLGGKAGDFPNLLINRDIRTSNRSSHVFSDVLKKEGKPTSQKSSGRCWLFAALNIMRIPMMHRLGLPESFELSQTYLFFYDKLERSNYFLESILDTSNESTDSRLICHLLKSPLNDGGQWDMIVNLVHKYGVVPKSVFPETLTSGASRNMNRLVTHKLRQYAMELRAAIEGGADIATLRKTTKKKMLDTITRILLTFFGCPPTKFDWSFYDKDKKHHCMKDLTPQEFCKNQVQFPITSYVSLINDPRNEYYKVYSVARLGNVIGEDAFPIRYLNVPIEDLKRYTAYMLLGGATGERRGSPVWFGCDFGKHNHRPLSMLDTKLMDYGLVFGEGARDNVLTKKDRLVFGESLMTHAMIFTGLDREQNDVESETGTKGKGKAKGTGKKGAKKKKGSEEIPPLPPVPDDFNVSVNKWRVENSHGEKGTGKGFLIMSDDWFDQYMYQVAVPEEVLAPKLARVLKETPIILPPWDPMGALAV